MKVNLLYISKVNQKLSSIESDLLKRISGPIEIQLHNLKSKRKHDCIDKQLDFEANLIEKKLKNKSCYFCFDHTGKKVQTSDFLNLILKYNQNLSLVIGSNDGISNGMKEKAIEVISFSDMVFSHGIFRLMVLEQLYRANCIMTNHPFHKN